MGKISDIYTSYKRSLDKSQQDYERSIKNRAINAEKLYKDFFKGLTCQGFSLVGKRNENDKRNLLYREIFRCLKLVDPKYFVIENVKGLAHLYNGKFLRRMLSGFSRLGYKVQWKNIDAKVYGVPQHRERIIIVGVKKNLKVNYEFPPAEYGPGLKPYNTLRDAIGEMDKPAKDDHYNKDDWPFFYMSRNRRAGWDSVSFTIQSYGRHIPIHPSCPPMVRAGKDKFKFAGKKKMYRRLSTRECARIQTFPDSFQFVGGLKSRYRLIGNAVPPLFARKIAESIKTMELSRFNKDAAEMSASRQYIIRQKVALMVQRKQTRPS